MFRAFFSYLNPEAKEFPLVLLAKEVSLLNRLSRKLGIRFIRRYQKSSLTFPNTAFGI